MNIKFELGLFTIILLIIAFLYYKLYKTSMSKINKDIKDIKNFTSLNANIFQYLADDKDVVIIDIRMKQEILNTGVVYWTNKHLEFDMHFSNKINNLDKTKKFLLVCASWNRTWQAMNIMKLAWFKNVHDLEWWVISWNFAWLSLLDWSYLFNN